MNCVCIVDDIWFSTLLKWDKVHKLSSIINNLFFGLVEAVFQLCRYFSVLVSLTDTMHLNLHLIVNVKNPFKKGCRDFMCRPHGEL